MARRDVVVGRVRPAEADVLAQGRVEEEALLGHEHHPLAQGREPHVAQVDAVDAHGALGRVHQPGQQLGEGGLARAGLADDGHPRPRGDREVDVVQDGLATGVGERDVRRSRP